MSTIQAAASELDHRFRQTTTRRRLALIRRRPLRTIDLIVDELERGHLDGRVLTGLELAAWQARLPGLVGRPAPSYVTGATSSVELHAALLDWQEELYDELFPHRQWVYPDLAARQN